MRRILLGGMGLAFGLLARPAVAQYSPDVSTQAPPASRAARLGRPIATTEPTANSVTPVGLIARGQADGAQGPSAAQSLPYPNLYPAIAPAPLSPAPYPAGLPVPSYPAPYPVGSPPPSYSGQYPATSPQIWTPGQYAIGTQAPTPPNPRQPQGGPTVTEIRGPATTGGPTTLGMPPTVPGTVVGVPLVGSAVSPGVTVVPSVTPGGDCLGGGCPPTGLGAPLYGDGPAATPPRFPAINRLLSCTNNRYWVSGEYLLWWTRSTQLPVLAATGPVPASPTDPVTTPTPILGGIFWPDLAQRGPVRRRMVVQRPTDAGARCTAHVPRAE